MLAALKSGSKDKSVLETALSGGGAISEILHGGSGGESSASQTEQEGDRKKPDLKSMLGKSSGLSAVNAFVMAGKAYRWRQHQVVLKSLDDWWTVMQQHLESRGKMEEGLDVEDYLFIFKLVYKALVQHYDEREVPGVMPRIYR